MAEETIITNVGEDDRSSVASEATLLSLVSAIEDLAKKAGINPASARAKVEKAAVESTEVSIEKAKKHQEAIKDNTKEFKEATKAVSAFSKGFGMITAAIGGIAQSGTALVKTLIEGGETLTDFAQHVPLVGNQLSILTGLIDQNISNFRELSQVGAVFGNGLNDIRLIAAQAAIPLSDFVDLIQQNSESMKLFGISTATGAREFARLSKELRDGVGRDLLNLGFTSSELNDLLIDYAELQARQFTRDRTQGRITAENAAEFGEQLLRISVITGKRREQIQDELRQQQGDIRIRAARSRLEATEGENFTLNLAMISGASSELANALVDINDGIPSGDVTRNLQNFSETFRNAGQDIAEMDPEEFNNFVVGVRKDLEEFARSQGRTLEELSSLPGFDGMFGVIGELQGFQEITAENREEILAAMQAERDRENALKNFQENLNVLRGQLMETFIDSGILPRITELFESFIGYLGRSNVIDSFMNAVSRVADFLLGPSINVGGDDPTEAIYERQGGFIDRMIADIEERGIGQVMLDLFVGLGSTLMEGAFNVIKDNFVIGLASLFAYQGAKTALTDGITRLFARVSVAPPAGAASNAAGAASAAGGRGAALRGILGRLAMPVAIAAIGYEFFKLYQRGPASDELMQELRDSGQFETFQEDWMNQPDSSDSDQSTVEPPAWWPSWMPTASQRSDSAPEESEYERALRNLEAERQQILESAAISGFEEKSMPAATAQRLDELNNEISALTNSLTQQSQGIDNLLNPLNDLSDQRGNLANHQQIIDKMSQNLNNQNSEISAAVRELREPQAEETEAVNKNTDHLETLNESNNTVVIELQRLITIMSEVRDTERSMLEIQQYLTQLSEEQLQELRDIDDNTDNLSADVSRGGITQFAS